MTENIGDNFKEHLNKAAANTVDTFGQTISGTAQLVNTTTKGSFEAADKITEVGLDAVSELGVSAVGTAEVVGKSGMSVVSTAAKSVAGTADAMYNTAAKMTEVAAAKGAAMAEKSIALNKAKAEKSIAMNKANTEAIHNEDNVDKMNKIAIKEQELELTKQEYEAEQAALRAEAQNETDLINTQINAVKSKVKKTGELTNVQNNALIKASEAKEAVMKAQYTAARIETEANNEIECRNVLTKAADHDSARDHNVLNNTLGHNTFCTNKKVCESTGKVHSWYNILGSNTTTCKRITEKYKTFKGMSSNAVAAAGGGRKTSRKKNTRRPKKNTRRPKKKTRKNKKNTRRTKKNTRRPKKKTRRTKRRSI